MKGVALFRGDTMDIRNKSIPKGHSLELFLIEKQNQLNMNQLKSNSIHVLSKTCIIPRGAGTLRGRTCPIKWGIFQLLKFWKGLPILEELS